MMTLMFALSVPFRFFVWLRCRGLPDLWRWMRCEWQVARDAAKGGGET